MKFLLNIFFLSLFLPIFGQDTIFLKDNSIIDCQIVKISKNSIIYQETPCRKDSLLLIKKDSVKQIECKNNNYVISLYNGKKVEGVFVIQDSNQISILIKLNQQECIKYINTEKIKTLKKSNGYYINFNEMYEKKAIMKKKDFLIIKPKFVTPFVKLGSLSGTLVGVRIRLAQFSFFELSESIEPLITLLNNTIFLAHSAGIFTNINYSGSLSWAFQYSLITDPLEIDNHYIPNAHKFSIGLGNYRSNAYGKIRYFYHLGINLYASRQGHPAGAIIPFIDIGFFYNLGKPKKETYDEPLPH